MCVQKVPILGQNFPKKGDGGGTNIREERVLEVLIPGKKHLFTGTETDQYLP